MNGEEMGEQEDEPDSMPQAGHSFALPSCKGAGSVIVDPPKKRRTKIYKTNALVKQVRHSVVRRVPKRQYSRVASGPRHPAKKAPDMAAKDHFGS